MGLDVRDLKNDMLGCLGLLFWCCRTKSGVEPLGPRTRLDSLPSARIRINTTTTSIINKHSYRSKMCAQSATDGPPPLEPSPSANPSASLHSWLGFSPSSSRLATKLAALSPSTSLDSAQVKAYPDSVYYNLHSLGLSLVFHPTPPYRPKTGTSPSQLDLSQLSLASIDLYNHTATLNDPSPSAKPPREPSTLHPTYALFPAYPVPVSYLPANRHAAEPAASATPREPATFLLTPETKGKELVAALGEPDRKGGGEGSLGIWVEWIEVGLMVEFASGGLQAWEKGGEAVWKCASFFERGVQVGKGDGEED